MSRYFVVVKGPQTLFLPLAVESCESLPEAEQLAEDLRRSTGRPVLVASVVSVWETSDSGSLSTTRFSE